MNHSTAAQRWSAAYNWRACLPAVLLACAALPIQIFAIPGFEFTPSLVLAPLALLFLDFKDRTHLAVLALPGLCVFLALMGQGSVTRNFMGAVSYGSPALYILVGLSLARSKKQLDEFWRITVPVSLLTLVILLVDLVRNEGGSVSLSAYSSNSYSSKETTFLQSIVPFYGKFGVITFSTVAMTVGALSIASASSFNRWLRVFVLVACNLLVVLAALMSSRQVAAGTLVFYIAWAAIALGWRHSLPVLTGALILAAAVVAYSLMSSYGRVPSDGNGFSTFEIIIYKVAKSVDEMRLGQFDDLTTGRISLWLHGIGSASPKVLAMGCGFCSLSDTYGFPFSTLHNVLLTATFKGGIVFAVAYIGTALAGIYLLATAPKSFPRNVTQAVLLSISFQALVNDVLFFQVIPQLLFALTGFLVGVRLTDMIAKPPHEPAADGPTGPWT